MMQTPAKSSKSSRKRTSSSHSSSSSDDSSTLLLWSARCRIHIRRSSPHVVAVIAVCVLLCISIPLILLSHSHLPSIEKHVDRYLIQSQFGTLLDDDSTVIMGADALNDAFHSDDTSGDDDTAIMHHDTDSDDAVQKRTFSDVIASNTNSSHSSLFIQPPVKQRPITNTSLIVDKSSLTFFSMFHSFADATAREYQKHALYSWTLLVDSPTQIHIYVSEMSECALPTAVSPLIRCRVSSCLHPSFTPRLPTLTCFFTEALSHTQTHINVWIQDHIILFDDFLSTIHYTTQHIAHVAIIGATHSLATVPDSTLSYADWHSDIRASSLYNSMRNANTEKKNDAAPTQSSGDGDDDGEEMEEEEEDDDDDDAKVAKANITPMEHSDAECHSLNYIIFDKRDVDLTGTHTHLHIYTYTTYAYTA